MELLDKTFSQDGIFIRPGLLTIVNRFLVSLCLKTYWSMNAVLEYNPQRGRPFSLFLLFWFTHETLIKPLAEIEFFWFFLLSFCRDNETLFMCSTTTTQKKGRRTRRESVSIWNTCHRGTLLRTTTTFQLNSFVPDAKEKAENTAKKNKTRVTRAAYLYLFTCAPPTETVYVAMALTRLYKGYMSLSLSSQCVTICPSRKNPSSTLSIEECWTTC